MPFRKALIWIKNQYNENMLRLILVSLGISVVLGGIATLLDFVLPWNQWGIIARSLLALPFGVSFFVFAYSLVILYVESREKNATEKEYLTWRQKLSPTMRNRLAIIFAAVLFVLMFAVTNQPGYSVTAGVIIAAIIGLFTFIRKTSAEMRREMIGLPDPKDASFDAHLKKVAATSKLSSKAKKLAKEAAEDKVKETKLEEKLEK